MKQIIEEVIQAEKNVNTILQQARDEASDIIRSAEEEIANKMSEAKGKAQEIVQATVEEAKKEAERIREEKLRQAEQEADSLLNNNADAGNILIDAICNLILTTEYDKDA